MKSSKEKPLIKADLHVHTCYSPDSTASLKDIIEYTQRAGIDCLAITDHNTIAGALRMKQLAPFHIIVGEEIMTSAGEIIGYFLKEEIPPGLSPEETISRIKSQGGLVCVPHPFDIFVRTPLQSQERDKLLPQIDIIEVFNSRSLFLSFSTKARNFAQKHNFLASAGSDAHTPGEIGKAYVEMPDFNGPEEFKLALKQGKVHGERTNPWIHAVTALDKIARRFKRIK